MTQRVLGKRQVLIAVKAQWKRTAPARLKHRGLRPMRFGRLKGSGDILRVHSIRLVIGIVTHLDTCTLQSGEIPEDRSTTDVELVSKDIQSHPPPFNQEHQDLHHSLRPINLTFGRHGAPAIRINWVRNKALSLSPHSLEQLQDEPGHPQHLFQQPTQQCNPQGVEPLTISEPQIGCLSPPATGLARGRRHGSSFDVEFQ
jgi:hypothetical protein